jgi:hypothetical protein
MVRLPARFRFGVVAAAAIAIGMILVPTSGTAFAAQTAQAAPAQTYIYLGIVNASGDAAASRSCDSYISNLGLESGDVVYASNGCNGRLWLHRLSNGGGASLCISPNSIDDADFATESITATTNPDPC